GVESAQLDALRAAELPPTLVEAGLEVLDDLEQLGRGLDWARGEQLLTDRPTQPPLKPGPCARERGLADPVDEAVPIQTAIEGPEPDELVERRDDLGQRPRADEAEGRELEALADACCLLHQRGEL